MEIGADDNTFDELPIVLVRRFVTGITEIITQAAACFQECLPRIAAQHIGLNDFRRSAKEWSANEFVAVFKHS